MEKNGKLDLKLEAAEVVFDQYLDGNSKENSPCSLWNSSKKQEASNDNSNFLTFCIIIFQFLIFTYAFITCYTNIATSDPLSE